MEYGLASLESPSAKVNSRPLGLDAAAVGERVYGYPVRSKLFPGEDAYFKANPKTTGMAAEDGSIILNPYSALKQNERAAVAQNEAFRLHMRSKNIIPQFSLTQQQEAFFKGTPYENAHAEKRQTIAARILSGDPSAMATPEQTAAAQEILRSMPGHQVQGSKR